MLRLAKILAHSFIIQSGKGPFPFGQLDVTSKTGHSLRRLLSRAFFGDFPRFPISDQSKMQHFGWGSFLY